MNFYMSLSKKFIELVKEDMKEDFYLQYRGVDLRRICQIIVKKTLPLSLKSIKIPKVYTRPCLPCKNGKFMHKVFKITFYETFR